MDSLLEFNETRAEKVMDGVFVEEKNDAPRYNPFALPEGGAFLDRIITAEYDYSASLKKITG